MMQLDLLESRRLRDAGIDQVTDHSEDWHSDAIIITLLIRNRGEIVEPFVAEDLRDPICEEIGNPHHHNCWGALMMALARAGVVKKTGTYRQAALKSSHARVTAEYSWVR